MALALARVAVEDVGRNERGKAFRLTVTDHPCSSRAGVQIAGMPFADGRGPPEGVDRKNAFWLAVGDLLLMCEDRAARGYGGNAQPIAVWPS